MSKGNTELYTIGSRILDLRKKSGITQAELARRIHITRSSVNSWEQEITYPSIDNLCSLADIFHTSIDYLVGFSNNQSIHIEKYTDTEQEMLFRLLNYFDSIHEMLEK